MKIIVELSDDSLRHAIEQQVGKAVSEFTDQVIREKVQQVIDAKMARLEKQDIEGVMQKAATTKINEVLGEGNDYNRKNAIRAFLADAAEKAIKGAR